MIRVSNIGPEGCTGHFLGWQLALYGSIIDTSITGEYELSIFKKVLPSIPSLNSLTGPQRPSTTTKVYSKPTDHLPGDHGETGGKRISLLLMMMPQIM